LLCAIPSDRGDASKDTRRLTLEQSYKIIVTELLEYPRLTLAGDSVQKLIKAVSPTGSSLQSKQAALSPAKNVRPAHWHLAIACLQEIHAKVRIEQLSLLKENKKAKPLPTKQRSF